MLSYLDKIHQPDHRLYITTNHNHNHTSAMADDPSSPVDPSSPKPDVEDGDAVKAAVTPEAAASDPAGPDVDDDNDDAAPEKNGSDDDDEEEEQLSDVDEDFEDYDPATAEIAETEDRPAVTIDEEAARGLKASKRKRTGDDGKPRKPKEGRREKKRRPGDGAGAADGDSDDEEGGEATATSKRARRSRPEDGGAASAPRRKKSASPEVNEEDLTPEERRKRALNRAIDLAIRNPNKRRRKADEDVSSPAS